MRRLFLLGDGAVLDALGELAGRLRYDEVHRSADPPEGLGLGDDVVLAASGSRGRALLDRVLAAGTPGYLGLLATDRESELLLRTLAALGPPAPSLDRVSAPAGSAVAPATDDEQAIAVAAELISARRWRQQ